MVFQLLVSQLLLSSHLQDCKTMRESVFFMTGREEGQFDLRSRGRGRGWSLGNGSSCLVSRFWVL